MPRHWTYGYELSTKEKKAKFAGFLRESGKRLDSNWNSGTVGRQSYSEKTRQVAQITAFKKGSPPRISLLIHEIKFLALFDTGAARSLLHENIFKQLPPELQTGVVPSDVDLVDVHNRKLFVFGKILLPFKYGNHILDQEFIITSGISEECILGLDAAFTHAFVLDGRSKTVYLSRDKAVKDLLSPDVPLALTLVSKLITLPLTTQVCIATIIGLQDVVLPESSFLFTPSTDLPEGISIEYFMGETNQTGEYQIIVENASNRPIVLPRGSNLGSIELSCHVIGKSTYPIV